MSILKTIEILGLFFGLSYLLSMIKGKWFSWPLGIIAVSLYGVSSYYAQLYGEMSLQVIYVGLSIFGWISWKKNETTVFTPSKIKHSEYIFIFIISLFLSSISYLILKLLHGSSPIMDAISNGFSLVATYLMTKKKIENWLIWVPTNMLIVYLMYTRGMPFYSVLYLCYGLFAILGYFEWKKKLPHADK